MSEPIHHQPHRSEDVDLSAGGTYPYYFPLAAGVVELKPNYIDYPETRLETGAPAYSAVYPDEFLHFGSSSASPNDIMPEPNHPDRILGTTFTCQNNPFDWFLEALLQYCRNYNLDLFNLRQELFKIRNQGAPSTNLHIFTNAFRASADALSLHLAKHDPRYPNPPIGSTPLANLMVEFVKINSYIASIRAGAYEPVTMLNQESPEGQIRMKGVQLSSLSHISIRSMFSSATVTPGCKSSGSSSSSSSSSQ